MATLHRIQEEDAGPERGDATPGEPEAIGGRHSPLRRCIVTGAVGPKAGMIRFVLGPDGAPVPDLEGTLPGRGLWVTAERAVLDRAVARNVFAKAARRPVRVPEGLAQVTADLLKRRCLDMLGLARKAGRAVAGFEKVRSALQTGKAAVLLAAEDGAEDGRGRLRALTGGSVPIVALFKASELGPALGRDHTVHAALAPGGLAERFLTECRRYAGLTPGSDREICGPASPAGQQE
jgi:hypothetical protein